MSTLFWLRGNVLAAGQHIVQHLFPSPHQSSTLRGRMLNWLSRWGLRLWRSCCYPFQFLSSRLSSVPEVSEDSASREVNRRARRTVKSTGAELPFDWVVEHRLAIGPLPRKGWEQDFENQGIHAIISLCDEAEGKLPKAIAQKFRCVRVPLPDSRYRRALTVEELSDAVDLVHWYLQKQQSVYLHCLAGVERSPLVAIAYLARYRSMDLLDAVGWLSHVHGRSRPMPAQLKVVREYLQNS